MKIPKNWLVLKRERAFLKKRGVLRFRGRIKIITLCAKDILRGV